MDLAQDHSMRKALYMPGKEDFTEVTVPELLYAAIDGAGPPGSAAIAAAIGKLLAAIEPIRRIARERMGKSFIDAPVEVLYWEQDGTAHWRAMIVLPAFMDQAMFDRLVPAPGPRLLPFAEGRCVQILHVGDPGDIGEMLERLHTRFLPEHQLEASGPYHEIYLDDWHRTAPARRKIILRQAVRPLMCPAVQMS